MNIIINSLVSVGLVFTSSAAMAHGEASKPKHGGIIAKVEPLEAELVAAPTRLTLYVYDHGKPVGSKGGSAKLTVLAGGKKSEITLLPAGDNKLEASIAAPLAKGSRVVGVLTVGGNPSLSMRWATR